MLEPSTRPDGRNGSCDVHVAVSSGGLFSLGIAVSGIATGLLSVATRTYGLADKVTRGPAVAPESGTPA